MCTQKGVNLTLLYKVYTKEAYIKLKIRSYTYIKHIDRSIYKSNHIYTTPYTRGTFRRPGHERMFFKHNKERTAGFYLLLIT